MLILIRPHPPLGRSWPRAASFCSRAALLNLQTTPAPPSFPLSLETTPKHKSQQIAAIALALPLLSYVSFQDDYRGMRPWSPRGLLAICQKTYASIDERGRVRQKNL